MPDHYITSHHMKYMLQPNSCAPFCSTTLCRGRYVPHMMDSVIIVFVPYIHKHQIRLRPTQPKKLNTKPAEHTLFTLHNTAAEFIQHTATNERANSEPQCHNMHFIKMQSHPQRLPVAQQDGQNVRKGHTDTAVKAKLLCPCHCVLPSTWATANVQLVTCAMHVGSVQSSPAKG